LIDPEDVADPGMTLLHPLKPILQKTNSLYADCARACNGTSPPVCMILTLVHLLQLLPHTLVSSPSFLDEYHAKWLHETNNSNTIKSISWTIVGSLVSPEEMLGIAFLVRRSGAHVSSSASTELHFLPLISSKLLAVILSYVKGESVSPSSLPSRKKRWMLANALVHAKNVASICWDRKTSEYGLSRCAFVGKQQGLSERNPEEHSCDPLVALYMLYSDKFSAGQVEVPTPKYRAASKGASKPVHLIGSINPIEKFLLETTGVSWLKKTDPSPFSLQEAAIIYDVHVPPVSNNAPASPVTGFLLLLQATWDALEAELRQANLLLCFKEMEAPLYLPLSSMELSGIRFLPSTYGAFAHIIQDRVEMLAHACKRIAEDEEFSPSSSKQVAEVLYGKLGLSPLQSTSSGSGSGSLYTKNARKASDKRHEATDEKTLETILAREGGAANCPFPAMILAFRKLFKIQTGFLTPLMTVSVPEAVANPSSGFLTTTMTSFSRIHTQFHQTATGTGRLSSSSPNLQNIPSREADLFESMEGLDMSGLDFMPSSTISGFSTETSSTSQSKKIHLRSAFKPSSESYVLISIDYSQIEVRLMAHFSNDKNLVSVFSTSKNKQHDIYAVMAARIFHGMGVGIDDSLVSSVTSSERKSAKVAILGTLYMSGPETLAAQLGIPLKDAIKLRSDFLKVYPGISTFINNAKRFVDQHEAVVTLSGRRRLLPEIHPGNSSDSSSSYSASNKIAYAQRQAVNTILQGTAADIIKISMILVDQHIQKKYSKLDSSPRLILQIHDELVFECPKNPALIKEFLQEVDAIMTIVAPSNLIELARATFGSKSPEFLESTMKLYSDARCGIFHQSIEHGFLVPFTTSIEGGYSWGEMKPIDEFLLSLGS
jgi:DNA polymerase I-like protein with 3'-5' exonuclease and polymerase domains